MQLECVRIAALDHESEARSFGEGVSDIFVRRGAERTVVDWNFMAHGERLGQPVEERVGRDRRCVIEVSAVHGHRSSSTKKVRAGHRDGQSYHSFCCLLWHSEMLFVGRRPLEGAGIQRPRLYQCPCFGSEDVKMHTSGADV